MAAFAMHAPSPVMAADGPASQALVVDGDTIQTADGVYHLYGIDAPELGQRCRRAGRWTACGKDAAFALHRLLGLALSAPQCTVQDSTGPDTTQSPLAVCALDDKKDLALVLLSQGLAVTLSDAPARYREAEESARAGRLGVWSTDFVHPRGWRNGERNGDDTSGPDPACPIKALTDETGHPIYLVPLDPGYADVPDSAVSALYCSDEAAEADGWHRPPLAWLLGTD
ncbi:thermonuclease family protein [Roseospira marina]|uniref:thermonuclease family protein n=1 Tax=Roseospira marina TaxID=140057 RepID=UPI001478E979|nr:thermonuclease family protein [Roseospira marina]MBB4314961.1 endonuclease YncB(thermonuclease family) [Roseospira marina]